MIVTNRPGQPTISHMDVVLPIPDALSASGHDLSRRALEAFAIAEYRAGHLSRPALSRLLGFATGTQRDAFLKAHGEYDGMTLEDIDRELQPLPIPGP
jgi:hypothetical protein